MMIRITRSKNFPQWLDIYVDGVFKDNARNKDEALKMVKQLYPRGRVIFT